MARTHKTTVIQAQMAEKVRLEEEEARRRNGTQVADLESARTSSEKAGAFGRASERQSDDPVISLTT
ncbi:hypothetical protein GN244_ATG03071 [Phytophthora infestans]|uniref:Uncharacterized protein n=1 Tax=Phytophthora infestans TaxID=4787 RepID=A0A833WLA0_PHYIN|nr:hypothetical protein GN244_ATG03071 [Phytophthora infestans]KAF4148264.1 hypothetical protein GN958_ATG02588 [Phytophthora infestans]